jgi:hypothetical protein
LRRHPALEQLSRDHHHALVVAQRLKRADADSPAEARGAFLAYWDPGGRHHFHEEEDILLPGRAGVIDPEHPLIAKVLTDHVRIRHRAGELAGSDPPPPALLRELGGLLEAHVRREERQLFPMIEESLPDEALRRLVDLLARQPRASTRPAAPAPARGGPSPRRRPATARARPTPTRARSR